MMRKFKIPVGLVVTSPLQRAVDTGKLLGYGETVASPDLAEAGAAIPPEENKRRAEALRKLVSLHPPADNNLVIVTHKPNILEAFGQDWSEVREGEASVFEPDGKGGYKFIVRIRQTNGTASRRPGIEETSAMRADHSSSGPVASGRSVTASRSTISRATSGTCRSSRNGRWPNSAISIPPSRSPTA